LANINKHMLLFGTVFGIFLVIILSLLTIDIFGVYILILLFGAITIGIFIILRIKKESLSEMEIISTIETFGIKFDERVKKLTGPGPAGKPTIKIGESDDALALIKTWWYLSDFPSKINLYLCIPCSETDFQKVLRLLEKKKFYISEKIGENEIRLKNENVYCIVTNDFISFKIRIDPLKGRRQLGYINNSYKLLKEIKEICKLRNNIENIKTKILNHPIFISK